MTRPIRDLDVSPDRLQQQIADLVDRQNKQRADESATPDPSVGLNPTGRPRRSSAPSRRKHARRTTEETP